MAAIGMTIYEFGTAEWVIIIANHETDDIGNCILQATKWSLQMFHFQDFELFVFKFNFVVGILP